MTGDTPSGPLFLGRWQRPAALVNAGLVPPDPYPLEKLLFCAGCGQQFLGTHRTSGGGLADGTRVAGTRLTSTGDADGTHIPGSADHPGGAYFPDCDHFPDCVCPPEDPRVYGTFCDCRPGPLPAFAVELHVHTETHLHAFDVHEPVPGLTKAHYTVLAIRFFTRVEIGPTVDHMTFTARV